MTTYSSLEDILPDIANMKLTPHCHLAAEELVKSIGLQGFQRLFLKAVPRHHTAAHFIEIIRNADLPDQAVLTGSFF
jgi:hypothetical protein